MPTRNLHLAELFKLLANPIRIALILLVNEKGELPIRDIVDAIGIPALTLSPHLARLRRFRILDVTYRQGMAYYELLDPAILKVIESMRSFQKANFKM